MKHPYQELPFHCFWSKTNSLSTFNPVIEPRFKISKRDLVATAGSCFAQHIAKNLESSGFSYYVAENAHPVIPPEIAQTNGYGVFSARYGNIYTTRQLKQLIQRALGLYTPAESTWSLEKYYVDPFRPRIQPGGFISQTELSHDREIHLAAVNRMLRELDVFVYTLGLTEAWESLADGAIFPICPGVAGGTFEATKHRFINFRLNEVVDDLLWSIDKIREINQKARILLTVSPVPLAATACADSHVAVSTCYSKSVLRVAAEEARLARSFVEYFPSYEIITSSHSRGAYFSSNLRDVQDAGVQHVIRVFNNGFLDKDVQFDVAGQHEEATSLTYNEETRMAMEVICDEALLDPGIGSHR